MKQINIKNRLYLLLTLLFCICLQATETTQLNTKPTSIETSPDLDNQLTQQAFNDFELDSMRRPTHHHAKPPKPNGFGSSHMSTLQNMFEAQQNAPGSLDLSFGTGGYVINAMGFNTIPKAVVTQSDNKIVVAGARDGYAFLARYNEKGELDEDFGGVGTYGPGVTIQTSLGKGSSFNAVAIQEQCCNEKIIAVGGSANHCIIARYHEGGTLDTTFGDKGIIKTNLAAEINSVVVQLDGKILVAGYKNTTTQNPNPQYENGYPQIWPYRGDHLVLIRYNEDGTLDNTFGTNGIIITPITDYTRLYNPDRLLIPSWVRGIKIVLQNNIITIIGTFNPPGTNQQIAIKTYNMNGQRHNIFVRYNDPYVMPYRWYGNFMTKEIGSGDYVPYDAIANNNGIFIVGSSILHNNKKIFTTLRLRPETFGWGLENPTITPTGTPNDNAYAKSIVLDENEKYIVMGSTITTTNDNYFSLVRYNKNASLDTIFGNQGIQNSLLTLNNKPNKITIPAIGSIQQDKKKLIVVSMYSDKVSPTSGLMAVARYHN